MRSVWTRSPGIACWGILLAIAVAITPASPAQAAESTAAPGRKVDIAGLGNLLKGMGLKPVQEESRYDFQFKAVLDEEEWELSMSAVLSQNGKSVWVMAWLDELPKSPADVSRLSLLRLLSDNDRLGNGKFFAYIASNRRFVLQRVLPNQGLDARKMQAVLQDLGASVVQTYPHWNSANWKVKSSGNTQQTAGSKSKASPRRRALKSATNDSKFKKTRQQ